ncbi:MAG: DUF4124 domain-containing protein [Gammaproteobacteria bacterium]|nr:DUF4124 domain-containing protein [Gammaproteobacteria bacterium]
MSPKTFHLIVPVAAAAAIVSIGLAARAQTPDAPAASDSSSPTPTGPTSPGGRMYRWVDKNNTVHYSDRPQPGAESVPVQAPQTYSAPRPAAPSPAARSAAGTPAVTPAAPACGIISPSPGQVFPNVQSVMISYRGPSGGTAQLQLSGTLNETRSAPAGQAFTIAPVSRGTYTARVSISGEPGVAPCVTPPVTFHVRQPSLLSPVRRQMNRPPAN